MHDEPRFGTTLKFKGEVQMKKCLREILRHLEMKKGIVTDECFRELKTNIDQRLYKINRKYNKNYNIDKRKIKSNINSS